MATTPFDKPIVSPVVIGRTRELETLERALHAAQQGAGQCILIAGDAGVGKTRLIAEIRNRAVDEHFLVIQGDCFEQDSSFPYAPLVDALRAYLGQRTPDEIRTSLGAFAPEIVKLVPELALTLPDLRPTPALDSEAEKRRLFESVSQLLIHLTVEQPLLVVLEDLHWSDSLSLDFLHLFARRLAAHPILLLASYRPEEAPVRLTHLLAQFDRERLSREIVLAPLTRDHVDAVLRAIFDSASPVQGEFLDLLYRLTEGNPFWVEQVLQALVAGGEISNATGRWEGKPIEELHIPRSAQDLVRRRTEQLNPIEQQVLTLASVTGQRFGFALLRETTGLNEPELVQIIKRLIAANLVVEESADQYVFRHALMREAVYAALLRKERKTLHQRIAESLERIHASAPDPHLGDLAYHFFNAGAWDKALHYSRLAGEKALALYAPREAIDHLTRAVDATRQKSLSPPIEVLRLRGKAYETADDFESARVDYELTLRAAHAARDGGAEWQALIDLGFLWASRDYSRTGDHFRRALDLARGLGEPSRLAHSLNRLGNWHVNVEQPLDALRYHEEALAVFERLGDKHGVAQTLDLLGMANYLGGDLIRGTACYEHAIGLFRELEDRLGLVSSMETMTMRGGTRQTDTMVPASTLTDCVHTGEMAVMLAGEINARSSEAYARLTLAFCVGAQGEYGRALALAHKSLEIATEIEHRQWATAANCVLGTLYQDMLELQMARHRLEPALAQAREIGSRHWLRNAAGFLASTYISLRELERAESVLSTALGSESEAQSLGGRLCWCARAELALARRDPDLALQIVDRLVASAANLSDERVIPRLWKLRGEAFILQGKAREAQAALAAARDAALAQGARPLLWRIRVALGKLYQTETRRDEAAAEFSAAAQMVQSLAGSLPDGDVRVSFVDRAMEMMPRIPAPSARRAEKIKYGGLTARERQVAALVAEGKSNREIANALVVSERTVESHVTNVLTKLGFATRAQISAWVVGMGLEKRPE